MANPRTFILPVLIVGSIPSLLVAQVGYGGYGTSYYRSSTVGESHARGMADVVRSAGDANLANSKAANEYEEARSKNFDNRLKYTETFFQQKQLNREYRKAKRGPRPSPEQIYRSTRARMPDRPTSNQLDPVYGQIEWPLFLQQDEFSEHRARLETLFGQRAVGKASIATTKEILAETDAMAETLRKLAVGAINNETIAATKFLRSLKYETRFSPS